MHVFNVYIWKFNFNNCSVDIVVLLKEIWLKKVRQFYSIESIADRFLILAPPPLLPRIGAFLPIEFFVLHARNSVPEVSFLHPEKSTLLELKGVKNSA